MNVEFPMKTRDIALIALMSALTVAIAYSKGLALSILPGLIDFMTVIIFVNGFSFGSLLGGLVGAISMLIYMLIPYPFAHPSAWLFTISPILLLVQAILGAMYGVVGGLWGRGWIQKHVEVNRGFLVKIALLGGILTFIYQIVSSIGFYLAYPIYPSVWDAIYFTFIPLYYPYPPITQVITNTLIFAIIGAPLIVAIQRLPFFADI
jgi:hypothetical protein